MSCTFFFKKNCYLPQNLGNETACWESREKSGKDNGPPVFCICSKVMNLRMFGNMQIDHN